MKSQPPKKRYLSNAFQVFEQNMKDVDRLMELHTQEGGKEPGRRFGLEVLNKSAIVLITSFWEAFCEDLASDILEIYVKEASTFEVLPLPLRKQVASELKKDVHELAPWKLAGEGWRSHLSSRLDALKKTRNWNFNSPKSSEADSLFKDALGIPQISDCWKKKHSFTPTKARDQLNKFVTLRGEIAHRGKVAKAVSRTQVTNYFRLVTDLARITEGKAWVDAIFNVNPFSDAGFREFMEQAAKARSLSQAKVEAVNIGEVSKKS